MSAQLSVIKGAMQSLANGAATGLLESLGVLPDDLKLVTGERSWTAAERHQVTRALDILMFGTMDVLGLPRISVPAEFVAATISMFVQPSNLMVACRWMESTDTKTAEAIGNPQGTVSKEPVNASQLFALVLQLVNDGEVAVCRAQFEARTAQAITKVIKQDPQPQRGKLHATTTGK